jgi:hypothetical protein
VAFGDILEVKTNTLGDPYGTTCAITFDSLTEGNLVVVCHFTGATNSSPAPSGYSETGSVKDGGNADEAVIYYKIAGSSEPLTVTCTSDSSDEHMVTGLEIEGPWNDTPLDVSATSGAQSTSSPPSGTTGVTAQNDEFAVAQLSVRDSDGAEDFTSWTNSFVERSNIGASFKSHAVATKLLTSTGAQSTAASITSPMTCMGNIATFKKQAAPAAGQPMMLRATTVPGMRQWQPGIR